MKTTTLKQIINFCMLLILLSGCKNDNFHISEDNLSDFHIKSISDDLEIVSKALSQFVQNGSNVHIIKSAIYQKKKDENITLKDLYSYFENIGGESKRFNLEEYLLSEINKYKAMNLEELRSLVDYYDLSIYWEFIQLWDGTTTPQVGYPINEEEDVSNDYKLMSYKVFTTVDDKIGIDIERAYLTTNPVLLVRPLENFENGGETYHSDQTYVWLEDLKNQETASSKDVGVNGDSLETSMDINRCRLYAINTNGKSFDGIGGPEFRFWIAGTYLYKPESIINFDEIAYLNLTSSAAKSTSWIYPRNTVNDILDEFWISLKWRQVLGCYEKDGGLKARQKVEGSVVTATNKEVVTGEVNFKIKIDRKDDKIYQHDMSYSSFLKNIKGREVYMNTWGMIDNWPIYITNNPNLKIAYSNF